MNKKQEVEILYRQYRYAIPDFDFFMELIGPAETKQEQIHFLQRVVIGQIQEGNKEVRKQFVEQNLGLIVATAKKVMERRTEIDGNFIEIGDLCQEGYLVFDQCLDRYDVEKDTMFSTYVVTSMQYQMQKYLRRQTDPLYVSEYQHEKGLKESRPYSYVSLDCTIQEEQRGRMGDLLAVYDETEDIMKSVDILGTLKQVLVTLPKIEREFFVWHYLCGLPKGQFQYHHNFTSNKVAKLNKDLHYNLTNDPQMKMLQRDYVAGGMTSSLQKVKTK